MLVCPCWAASKLFTCLLRQAGEPHGTGERKELGELMFADACKQRLERDFGGWGGGRELEAVPYLTEAQGWEGPIPEWFLLD